MAYSSALLKADLILLPHHGEKLSPERESFVDWVKPDYAVISQGRAAGELSRSEDTAGLLSSKGIRVFRTNSGGAIFASTGGKDLFVDNFESRHTITR